MSIKIIHCADLHLDSKMESNLSTDQAEQRRQELTRTFERLTEYAEQHHVSAVIIAGDLFDTAKSAKRNIKKRIAYIMEQHPSITFYYLRGNHDSQNCFADMNIVPPNVIFFTADSWTTHTVAPGICITGRELPDVISDSVYHDLVLDINALNIVVMHGQIVASSGAADAPLINLQKLANRNIDYLALGHIHSYSSGTLDARGTYCYAGCLEGRGFDECGPKGFVELSIDNQHIEQTFVPFCTRQLHTVECNVSGLVTFSEVMAALKASAAGIPPADLVKFVLTGDVSESADIDSDLCETQLKDMFFFEKVRNETEIKIDYEKYRNDISLKGEFVRTVESRNLPPADKSRIIMAGLAALAGKELR